MGKLFCQVIQSHFLSSIVSNPILLSCLIHCCIVRLDMINWKTNSFCSKSNFVFFFRLIFALAQRLRCYPTKKMLPTPFFLKLKIGFQQKLNVQSKSYRWIDYLWKIKPNWIKLKAKWFLLILTAAQRWTPFTNPTQAQPKSNQSGGWRNEEIVRWLKKRRNWDRERVKDQFLWRTPSKTYR